MKRLPKAIYEQAEQFLEWNVQDKVYSPSVDPQWNQDGTTFWYRKTTEQGTSFVFVDPFIGEILPAFNHQRLAEALSRAWRKDVDPHHLPIDSFSYTPDGESILFRSYNLLWRCHLETYSCHAVDSSHLPAPNALRSPNNRWDLFCEEGNLCFVSREEERWQWTTDARPGVCYGCSPDTNLSFVTRQRTEFSAPPIALWSPDGTKVLSFRLDQRRVATLPLVQHCPEESYRPKLYEYHYPFVGDPSLATQELLVFDMRKKVSMIIQSPPLLVETFSLIELGWAWWSNDSKKIYFLREERGAKELSLCVADAETGAVRTLITEKSEEYVEPSSLAPWPCYAQVVGDKIVWLSEQDGWAHLYLHDATTGECLHQITSGPWNVTKVLGTDDNYIYFMGCGLENHRDPYYPHMYRIRFDGTEMKLLTSALAAHYVHLSPSKKVFVDNYSTLTMDIVPSTEVYTVDGTKILDLENGNVNALFSLGWRPPDRFSAKARNGKTPIYGAIYYPSHFDSEQTYPVIDLIFTGPQLVSTPKGFSTDSHEHAEFWPGPWMAQSLAELGFIVVQADGFGTPLRSRSFHHVSFGQMEDAYGLEDHVHVLKELASEKPFMDLNSVGIFGHSAGGYAAVRALIDFPDFYRVAVASAGDHDLLCYLAYWGEKYHGLFDAEQYTNQSNADWAEQIQGKLFLVHGELDENVHPCGTYRLVQKLIEANKDFDFLILPNETHWCYENPYFIRRCWDFFVRNLMGKEPPEGYQIRSREEHKLHPKSPVFGSL